MLASVHVCLFENNLPSFGSMRILQYIACSICSYQCDKYTCFGYTYSCRRSGCRKDHGSGANDPNRLVRLLLGRAAIDHKKLQIGISLVGGWLCFSVVLQFALTVLLNMATQASVLNEIVSNAARAAESAAEAARALQEAQERPKSNFSEASKVVKCPEFFGYTTSDDDQNNWRDFAFAFKAWLVFADADFDRELALIERASESAILLPTDPGTLQRAYKLYAILGGLLRHRLLKAHRQVTDRNGFATWRQLCQLYEPRTNSRNISLLQALSFPNF